MCRTRLAPLALLGLFVGVVLLAPAVTRAAAPRALAGLEPAAAAAEQIDANLILQFLSPEPGQRLQGGTIIRGYAGDRRSRSGSGLNEVDVQLYLDAPADRFDPRYLLAVPGTRRGGELAEQDPACCHPELSGALVFRSPWSTCTFPAGRHTLTAWASSLVATGAINQASVAVEIEPCQPGQVLTRNDLSSAGNSITPQDRSTSYAPQPGVVDTIRADFAAGLDARCFEAESNCLVGLSFRSVPGASDRPRFQLATSEYAFFVNPSTRVFGLTYYPPGEGSDRASDLVPPTASSRILPGAEWNRLAVIAAGARLRLFINGTQVADVQHDGRPWGDLRWSAQHLGGTTPVVAFFRNLVVQTVAAPEALGPALRGE